MVYFHFCKWEVTLTLKGAFGASMEVLIFQNIALKQINLVIFRLEKNTVEWRK